MKRIEVRITEKEQSEYIRKAQKDGFRKLATWLRWLMENR